MNFADVLDEESKIVSPVADSRAYTKNPSSKSKFNLRSTKKYEYKTVPLEDFQKDTNYGEFEDLTSEEYNSIVALNSSSIKLGKKSGYHVDVSLAKVLKREPRRDFDLGTAFHYLVFEPEKFWNKIWTREDSDKDFDRRKKDDKEEWEYYTNLNEGKIYVKPMDLQPFERMYEALHSHEKISKLLQMRGRSEVAYVWRNEEFGLNCKSRVDNIIGSDLILDLKTTKDSSEYYFKRDYDKYEYDVQAAFYMDGYKTLYNQEIEFAFIAINKTEPYFPVLYEVKKTKDRGRENYKKYINKFLEHKANPKQIFDIVEI